MISKTERKPTDLLHPGLTPDYCVMDVDDGVLGEISDASRITRGKAIALYASEMGVSFTDVRCTTSYMRLFTRQDGWDGPGRERWLDDWMEREGVDERAVGEREWEYYNEDTGQKVDPPDAPDEPPGEWEPSDWDPAWEFCKKTDPGAVKVWVCEAKSR